MKQMKILIKAAIVIIVAMALIMPGSAIITNKEINEKPTMIFGEMKEPLKLGGPIFIPYDKETVNIKNLPKSTGFLGEDTQIINRPEYVIQNPTIATAGDPSKVMILFEFKESLLQSNIGLINSLDGGTTFADQFISFDLDGYTEFPDVDYVGNIEGKDIFRASAIDEIGTITVFLVDDIDNFENSINGYTVDWADNGFFDMQSCDIACNDGFIGPDGATDYYVVSTISSFSGIAGYEDQVQIPHYMVDAGGGGVSIYWFYYTDASNSKMDIDKASDYTYYAFEYPNGGSQDVILLSSENQYVGTVENEGGWGDGMGDGRKYQITGSANTINPAIAAENDYVYLILETDQDGNQDLVCYYSDDGGETYDMSIVADTNADERFPEIYADGKNAVIVFTKDNNLYSAKTSDGGINWEISPAINDQTETVVEQAYTSDIFSGKTVWTDNRGEEYSVFIDDAVEKPVLSVEEVAGGLGVSAKVKNIGAATATNVQWSITLDGLVLLGKEKSGEIASLAPGSEEEIASGLPLGLGNIEIFIAAECDEGSSTQKTASAKLLLIFITGLT